MLTIKKLEDLAEGIIKDYENMLNGKINKNSARKSIGYMISSLKKYEIEKGMYLKRSVCVIPTCTPIIDLFLIYDTDDGPIQFILTIRCNGKIATVYTNEITNYEDRDDINIKRLKNNSTLKSAISSADDTTIKKSKENTNISTNISPGYFLCPIKDTNCCWLSINHKENCNSCCLHKNHYSVTSNIENEK